MPEIAPVGLNFGPNRSLGAMFWFWFSSSRHVVRVTDYAADKTANTFIVVRALKMCYTTITNFRVIFTARKRRFNFIRTE